MKKICVLLACLFSVFILICGANLAQASNKQLNLKCQNSLPDKYVASKALKRFAEQVEKKTNGRIEITVFSTGQLFKDTDLPTALPSGAVDLALPNLGQWAGIAPSLAAMSLVGPYESAEHFYRLQEGKIGKLWDDDLQKRANTKVLSYMSLGSTDIITSPNKFIKSLDDFKGLKMQCATKGMQIFAEALGAVPTSISASDIYIALQRGTVDAAGSSVVSVLNRKWYEVSKYQTRVIMNPEGPFALLINLDVWKDISGDDQKILVECANEAWLWNRGKVKEATQEAWNKIKNEKNVQVYEFPVNTWKEWAKKIESSTRKYMEKTAGKKDADTIFKMIDEAR